MGSWIETCFITGLPIQPDDRVVMLGIDRPGAEPTMDAYQVVTVFLKYMGHGRHDSYGRLIGESVAEEWTTVFALESAWDWVVENHPLPVDVLAGDNGEYLRFVMKRQALSERDMREVFCVICYCYSIRISIYRGVPFKGCQHHEGKLALDHAEYVRKIAREQLTKQLAEEDDDYDYEEEDCDEARLREEGRRDAEHHAAIEEAESNTVPHISGVMTWDPQDAAIRHIAANGWTQYESWPGDEDYDELKAKYFPNHTLSSEIEEDGDQAHDGS